VPADGPILIAFDGSAASEHAVRATGELLRGRRALVLVVWKAGLGFELMELPTSSVGLPPAPIDLRTAAEIDQELLEASQRLAQKGAQLAQEAGFEAEGTTVAEDPGTPVAETIVRVAEELGAQAIAVGAHGHGKLSSIVLGSTSRDVIRHAACPVIVAREPGQG
jgi:nucleotide-binding universal stress UspA family protein